MEEELNYLSEKIESLDEEIEVLQKTITKVSSVKGGIWRRSVTKEAEKLKEKELLSNILSALTIGVIETQKVNTKVEG